MNELYFIHTHLAFVNDYLLTQNTRRKKSNGPRTRKPSQSQLFFDRAYVDVSNPLTTAPLF